MSVYKNHDDFLNPRRLSGFGSFTDLVLFWLFFSTPLQKQDLTQQSFFPVHIDQEGNAKESSPSIWHPVRAFKNKTSSDVMATLNERARNNAVALLLRKMFTRWKLTKTVVPTKLMTWWFFNIKHASGQIHWLPVFPISQWETWRRLLTGLHVDKIWPINWEPYRDMNQWGRRMGVAMKRGWN